MIERIMEQHWAVFQEMKKVITISPSEWDLLQELNVTLNPFLTARVLKRTTLCFYFGCCSSYLHFDNKTYKKMNNLPATEDDCDLSQQSTVRLTDFRAKTMSQLLSRWDFKSNPGNGFLIAAALDPRFCSLKFLEKIDGSCSKFDVLNSISSPEQSNSRSEAGQFVTSPEHVNMLTCLYHNLSSFGMDMTPTTEDMDLVDDSM